MARKEDLQSEIAKAGTEGDRFTSRLELQLAATVLAGVIQRNGGRDAADVFWDDDATDSPDEEDEYLDPELRDPDEETVPEMAEINWNIYECN